MLSFELSSTRKAPSQAVQLLGNGSLISASKHILGIIFEPHAYEDNKYVADTWGAPVPAGELHLCRRTRSDNATTPRNNPKGPRANKEQGTRNWEQRTCTSTCHGLHSQLWLNSYLMDIFCENFMINRCLEGRTPARLGVARRRLPLRLQLFTHVHKKKRVLPSVVWGQQQRRTKREPPAFRTTRAITQLRTFKFPFRFWKFATNTFPPSPTPPFTHAFRVGCNCRGVWERHRYMLLGQQHTALVYGDVLQLPAAGVAVQQKLITRHLCQQPATLFASRNTLSKNVTSIPPNPLLPLSSKTMLDSPHTHTHTHVTFLSAQKEMNCSVAIKTAIAVAFPLSTPH